MLFSVDIFKKCFIEDIKESRAVANAISAKKILNSVDGLKVIDVDTSYVNGNYTMHFTYNKRELVMYGKRGTIELFVYDEENGYCTCDSDQLFLVSHRNENVAKFVSWCKSSYKMLKFNNKMLW